jgi:uncharacterized membrane protein YeaQ/YmgE (transglycosylase-associated protein family)
MTERGEQLDFDRAAAYPSCVCAAAVNSILRIPGGSMVHGIIWWVVVGLIAGWAAGKIMKGGGYGVVADILLGIVGAFIGGWVVSLVGFGGGGLVSTILVAILGAVILIWLTRVIKRA